VDSGGREEALKFSSAVTRLEIDLAIEELALVLSELKDKGSDIEGASADGLEFLHRETQQWLLDKLNEVWRRGLMPATGPRSAGQEQRPTPHRQLLYHGLGIGAAGSARKGALACHDEKP
jgi:hypothetical protein